jgi:hypothetical protein
VLALENCSHPKAFDALENSHIHPSDSESRPSRHLPSGIPLLGKKAAAGAGMRLLFAASS